jgi:hypothetical protein
MRSPLTNDSTVFSHPERNKEALRSLIILVGGSIAKRRLFELYIEQLGLDLIVSHLTPNTLSRSLTENRENHWDPQKLIMDLSEHFKVAAVIPLVDSVVPFCDIACWKLGLMGNDPSTSHLRVDKFAMQLACIEAGIPHVRSEKVSSVNQAIFVWKEKFKSDEVVLKPSRSGGGDGVCVVRSVVELTDHIRRQLGSINLEKLRNNEIVIQELIPMNYEFIINTVSINGCHFVCDVWRSAAKRIGNLFIYDCQELVVDTSPYVDVIQYVKDALKAVQINFGAAHVEVGVMMQEGKVTSVRLIEVNARLAGEIRTSSCIPGWEGMDQVYWLLVSIAIPGKLLNFGIPKSSFQESGQVVVVFLRNLRNGGCRISEKGLRALRQLSSFTRFGRGLAWANDANSLSRSPCVPRTVDLVSSPGVVILVGASAKDDALRVRDIEEYLLYQPLHVC